MRPYLLILILLAGCGTVQVEELSRDEFTIIVLPDTQYYTRDNPDIFINQTKWIAANKEALNIGFVIHEGDIVQRGYEEPQWKVADEAFSILEEANIPYSIVPGNHEHAEHDTVSETGLMDDYFPVSRFENQPWWGGSYNGTQNSYHLITLGKTDFLIIGIDFCPSDDEIAWANGVIEEHPDRNVILTTHGYLTDTAERKVKFCEDTEYIWNDLITRHEKLQLVLCGHEHVSIGEARRTDQNDYGIEVHQILANYQDYPNSGDGWLRIMTFNPTEDTISIQTYSTYQERYDHHESGEFIIDYALS